MDDLHKYIVENTSFNDDDLLIDFIIINDNNMTVNSHIINKYILSIKKPILTIKKFIEMHKLQDKVDYFTNENDDIYLYLNTFIYLGNILKLDFSKKLLSYLILSNKYYKDIKNNIKSSDALTYNNSLKRVSSLSNIESEDFEQNLINELSTFSLNKTYIDEKNNESNTLSTQLITNIDNNVNNVNSIVSNLVNKIDDIFNNTIYIKNNISNMSHIANSYKV